MKHTIRTLSELGEDIVLAPERWLALAVGAEVVGDDEGVPLGDLVIERRERSLTTTAVVLDTTHARDGLLDIAAALRAQTSPKSAKKVARAGDLVISRLRPYLRQIAYVHPRALEAIADRELALSSEFYVLAPRHTNAGGLAFLLPFLLGEHAQAVLAAAQEGGHHPRVPRSSLLALRVPTGVMRSRERVSAGVTGTLESLYTIVDRWEDVLGNRLVTASSKVDTRRRRRRSS